MMTNTKFFTKLLKVLIIIASIFSMSCATDNGLTQKIESQLNDKTTTVNVDLIEKFATLSLKCINKKYPYKPGILLYKKEDLQEPKQRHPIFYGCYDWHSAVHGHWALVKIINNYPDFPLKSEIFKKLNKHFTKINLKKESKVFYSQTGNTFERLMELVGF